MYRAILVLLWLGLAVVPAASAKTDYVIVRDVSIGGFARTGTVRDAIRVFGRPTTRENQAYDVCTLTWRTHGVVMETYYTNATLDPCGPAGRHRKTTLTDRRWRTSDGLRIGDPLRRLRQLYPKARLDAPGTWRLTTRPFAGLPYPGVAAQVRNGRVVSFTVHGPRSAF
jgi:hypothetical protein